MLLKSHLLQGCPPSLKQPGELLWWEESKCYLHPHLLCKGSQEAHERNYAPNTELSPLSFPPIFHGMWPLKSNLIDKWSQEWNNAANEKLKTPSYSWSTDVVVPFLHGIPCKKIFLKLIYITQPCSCIILSKDTVHPKSTCPRPFYISSITTKSLSMDNLKTCTNQDHSWSYRKMSSRPKSTTGREGKWFQMREWGLEQLHKIKTAV